MASIESAGLLEHGSSSVFTLSDFLEDDMALVEVGKDRFIDIDSPWFPKPPGLIRTGWYCSEDVPGSAVKSKMPSISGPRASMKSCMKSSWLVRCSGESTAEGGGEDKGARPCGEAFGV